MRTALVLLALLASLATGCIRTVHLPRRPTPERVLPLEAPSSGDAPPGTAPIVIDVVDGPTRVERVIANAGQDAHHDTITYSTRIEDGRPVTYQHTTRQTYRYTRRQTAVVCPSTPCTAHLPAGDHTLVFQGESGESEVALRLAGRPMALRHALRLETPGTSVWGGTSVLWLLGVAATATGSTIAVYDVLELEDRETVGWTIAGAGLGAILFGTILLAANRSHVVTPGSILAWDL